jgi:hypothetical protein
MQVQNKMINTDNPVAMVVSTSLTLCLSPMFLSKRCVLYEEVQHQQQVHTLTYLPEHIVYRRCCGNGKFKWLLRLQELFGSLSRLDRIEKDKRCIGSYITSVQNQNTRDFSG